MRCPRCDRAGLAFEPWPEGAVAVCRHVRKCGWRMWIKNGLALTGEQREHIIKRDWQKHE